MYEVQTEKLGSRWKDRRSFEELMCVWFRSDERLQEGEATNQKKAQDLKRDAADQKRDRE